VTVETKSEVPIPGCCEYEQRLGSVHFGAAFAVGQRGSWSQKINKNRHNPTANIMPWLSVAAPRSVPTARKSLMYWPFLMKLAPSLGES
jgi:hypothetical protein